MSNTKTYEYVEYDNQDVQDLIAESICSDANSDIVLSCAVDNDSIHIDLNDGTCLFYSLTEKGTIHDI